MGGGEAGRAPFLNYTLAFSLHLRKITYEFSSDNSFKIPVIWSYGWLYIFGGQGNKKKRIKFLEENLLEIENMEN
jgi:hypothetical protein